MKKSPDWNVKKFEANLEREVFHRKITGSQSEIIARPASGTFEQFLLVGVPPNGSKKSEIKVLVAFPPFELANLPIKRIIEQCFPTGIERNCLGTAGSCPIQDEFIFHFSCGVTKYYGICAHLTPKSMSFGTHPFFATRSTKKLSFGFILLTQTPVFSTHLTFLSYLSLISIGKVQGLSKSTDELKVSIPNGLPIPGLDLTNQMGHHAAIKIPKIFEFELARYYQMNLTSPSVTLAPKFELSFPPASVMSKTILWASIDTLFSLLSIRDIINIVSGLILDAQVLVIGSHLQEVTMCVYGLQALMTPFNYSGTVFPVLPANDHFTDLLQLPTPFIFGTAPLPPLKKTTYLESCFLVYLDKKAAAPNDYFPPYPDLDRVVSNIFNIVRDTKNDGTENPFAFPNHFVQYLNHRNHILMQGIDSILMELHEPLKSVFTDDLTMFFVTDATEGITVFNQELFLASVDSKNVQFFEFLMESQTFQEYVEEKLSLFMKEKGEQTTPARARKSSFSAAATRKRSATRTNALRFDLQ